MNAILDTSILIDLLRNYPPAKAWQSQTTGSLGISVITRMELVEGARNRQEQSKALELMSRYELVYVSGNDSRWAALQHEQLWLSHNVGLTDCLIASAAQRLQLPLYTLNLKHFRPLLNERAQVPYSM